MCQNVCRSSERGMKLKGIHAVESTLTLFTHIEALTKQLVATQLAQANVSQIQILHCDFNGGKPANGKCTIEVESVEVQYANFQKSNP